MLYFAQYYHNYMMDNGDWVWSILMMLFWLIILAGMAYLGIRLVNTHERPTQNHDPLDIVKERYAKGEIDKEQFEQMAKTLSK